MKHEIIEWCEMTALQTSLYKDAIQRSRKTVLEVEGPTDELPDEPPAKPVAKKKKATTKNKEKFSENSSNVLMDLRKGDQIVSFIDLGYSKLWIAALHPMLFRSRFTNDMLSSIARLLLKEPDFRKRKAIFE
jgi:SWI/SNF-related matrix-associated actin-dependent regulator 1 of chromatin subfamily A